MKEYTGFQVALLNKVTAEHCFSCVVFLIEQVPVYVTGIQSVQVSRGPLSGCRKILIVFHIEIVCGMNEWVDWWVVSFIDDNKGLNIAKHYSAGVRIHIEHLKMLYAHYYNCFHFSCLFVDNSQAVYNIYLEI